MKTPKPGPRYAIYFVPAVGSALYRFGASVLGYDCHTGKDVALVQGVDTASWRAFVREPRVYGFHATLKAPFCLHPGAKEADLLRAAQDFAADMPAVLVGALAVREIDSFIALVPETGRPMLDRLAQACAQEFDAFRAPMTVADRSRRLSAGLSPRQIENLERWGYPYVCEDFRFHMTLTGSLEHDDRKMALRFLCEKFEQLADARLLTLDRIVVARQSEKSSAFRVIREAALGHSVYRPYAYTC